METYVGENHPKSNGVLWIHHDTYDDINSPLVLEVSKSGKYTEVQSAKTLKKIADLQQSKADLVNGTVPQDQLPPLSTYTQEVATYANLPAVGDVNLLYITLDTGLKYRWTGSIYINSDDPVAYATQAEAEGNVENTKVMTALRTYQNFLKNSYSANISTLNTPVKTIVGAVNALEDMSSRIKRDIGYNDSSNTVTITSDQAGKYVKCSTRVATANADFAISAPITVDACSEVLIKTGFNPSDSAHSALDLSVISFVHSIERQRSVQAKDLNGNLLYYATETDVDGNVHPIETQTTTVTGYPVYTTETYTDTVYTPNNEDKYVAIPDSGYYVANIPDAAQIVISYKPGVTDTNIIIVKHGNFANIVSQLGMLAFKERLPMTQAIAQLKEDLAGLRKIVMDNIHDLNSIPNVMGVPMILFGAGVPSSTLKPDNWPSGIPWDGIPFFKGQTYINTLATSGGHYYAKDNNSVSDWINS